VRGNGERALLDEIDAFRATQDDAPNRPEAVRRLVKAALAQKGYMSPDG